jgi:hypothetical protein
MFMKRALTVVGVSLLLSGQALADEGGASAKWSDDGILAVQCRALTEDFDRAARSQASSPALDEARTLRVKAAGECYGNPEEFESAGVDDLKLALHMIGVDVE